MTDYDLRIMSYKGLVPGATHFRGHVAGPYPRSCHGGTSFNAPEHRGKTTCEQGHELPGRDEWDGEAAWTGERFGRWERKHFEGDGPGQFLTEKAVIDAAVRRFTGQDPSQWWESGAVPGQPGDRLLCDGEVIAQVPASRKIEQPQRPPEARTQREGYEV